MISVLHLSNLSFAQRRAFQAFGRWRERRSRISVFRGQASKEIWAGNLNEILQIKLTDLPSWQNWWIMFAKKRYHSGSYASRLSHIMVLTAPKISCFFKNSEQISARCGGKCWLSFLAEELILVECYDEQPLFPHDCQTSSEFSAYTLISLSQQMLYLSLFAFCAIRIQSLNEKAPSKLIIQPQGLLERLWRHQKISRSCKSLWGSRAKLAL